LKTGDGYPFRDFRYVHLVPLVVTTASLLICEFNVGEVDLAAGEVPLDKATYTPVPYAVYEYPLTGGLAINPDDIELVDGESDVDAMVKL